MTDAELDERGHWFRQEILPLQPRLQRLAARFCRHTRLQPDDLVHDAFVRLYSVSDWRQVQVPAAFATTILRNLALSALRRDKVVSIVALEDLSGLDEGIDACPPDPERAAVAREELLLLQSVIETLPPQCRRVFTLRKIYNCSIAEVAEHLGISVSTAEKHLTKGLRLCSEALARHEGKAAPTRPARAWRKRALGST